MLIIFSGLPGVGKTTLAKIVAQQLAAVYLRIDTIEQMLISRGFTKGDIGSLGYVLGYSLAEENLSLGRTVIADAVNPVKESRDAWYSIAARNFKKAIEIEVVCSDKKEHCKRIEMRMSDIAGHKLPTWEDVLAREYENWDRSRVVIDTASSTPKECMTQLMAELGKISFSMPVFGEEEVKSENYTSDELALLRDDGR